jgi:hypothetical protein
MAVESFSRKVVSSGVLHTYIATGFFATLIFFVLNSHLFTPMEMMFGTIVVTIALKGVSNLMLSLIILLFDLTNAQEQHKFKLSEDRLNILLNEMSVAEASAQSSKMTKDMK